MNQNDQMREALEPIWYMHDNHCFTKLEDTVEECLATLERLLNKGETYGMLCSKRKGFECVHQKGTDDRVNFLSRCKVSLEKALAHVNETPKKEHDSADVLKPANPDQPLIWYMHDNHTFTKLEGSVEQCLATLERLLNEGETYGMLCSKRKGFEAVHQRGADSRLEFLNRCKAELEKHLNVSKQNRQTLKTESAPLVRLTEQDIEKLQHGDITCWNWDDTLVFANAVMDAMERVNGGSNATD